MSEQSPIVDNANIRAGSETLLKALQTGRGPDSFTWSMLPGLQPQGDGCHQLRTAERRLTLIEAKEAQAEARRVSREPCPWCGVRADIGCRHGRAL